VKAVSDLDRVRGTVPEALGIGPGPVPAHDLHAGMLAQPGGQRAGLTAGQHVDGPAGAHVDQDGVVGLAPADREIVAGHVDVPGPRGPAGRG
jgi:hypothetical protein